MAKSNEVEIKSVISNLNDAASCLHDARTATKLIKGCPEAITNRITSLKLSVVKATGNITKRLNGLSHKVERAAKAKDRKVARLTNLKASLAKVEAQIAEAEKV